MRVSAAWGNCVRSDDRPRSRHRLDVIGVEFRKPERARTRVRSNAPRPFQRKCRGKLGDATGWCDATDFATRVFREPEIPIGAGGNGFWLSIHRWDVEFGYAAGSAYAPDVVCIGLGEPKCLIGALRDAGEITVCSRNGKICS